MQNVKIKKSKLKNVEIMSNKSVKIEGFYSMEFKKEIGVIVTIAILMGYEISVVDTQRSNSPMIARDTAISMHQSGGRFHGNEINIYLVHDIFNKLVEVEIVCFKKERKDHWKVKQNSHLGMLFYLPKIKEVL